jgi:hypothetical protein
MVNNISTLFASLFLSFIWLYPTKFVIIELPINERHDNIIDFIVRLTNILFSLTQLILVICYIFIDVYKNLQGILFITQFFVLGFYKALFLCLFMPKKTK